MADKITDEDFDTVENLGDLIKARRDRDSAISADVDGMPDADVADVDVDANKELSQPHHHGPTEDERLGLDVVLMDTPDEKNINFDWQDSAEEMQATDPLPDEGMGDDEAVEELREVDLVEIIEPESSAEPEEETDTTVEEFELDGGDDETCPPAAPIPLESAMETDSDEEDLSIEDKFGGQVERETAELEFEEMKEFIEEEEDEE
ncbi:MAG: hypothetical protein NTU88_08065 [Armatimonadetes bacterium]|nr:hypothetical protein [Armatimonadota bacterium]